MAQQKIYATAPDDRQCRKLFEGADLQGYKRNWLCLRYSGHTGPCQYPNRERRSQADPKDQGIYTEYVPGWDKKKWTPPSCPECDGTMEHIETGEDGCVHWICRACETNPEGGYMNWPVELEMDDPCPVCEPKGYQKRKEE